MVIVVVAVVVGLKTVDVNVSVLNWITVWLMLVEVVVVTTVEVIVVGTMTVEVLVVVCSGASAGACMGRRTATVARIKQAATSVPTVIGFLKSVLSKHSA